MSLTPSSLPRLLQLCSPSLPVGAYAYSQGLECAVERGWVRDEASAGDWILGLLGHGLRGLDLPVLARLYRAWGTADPDAARHWNARLYASREAAELQREDRHLGTALARLLSDLGIAEAEPWRNAPRVCFATLFSLAAVRWTIPLPETATKSDKSGGTDPSRRRNPLATTRADRLPASTGRRRPGHRRRGGRRSETGG